jgi:hypothetical protein
MPFDVFEETPFGVEFANDPADVGPQVTGIVLAQSAASEAEGLAGISASEDMNLATPRAAVEGGNVVPDRCLIQGLVCHPRHESGRGECFPLDVTNRPVSGLCDVQTELEAADAGAERDSVEDIRCLGR